MSERTETIETAYGEATINLVECDSCGAEVATEDAEPFEIGDRSGVACPHCVDEGPISFPRRVRRSFGFGPNAEGLSVWGKFLFYPAVASLIPLLALTADLDTNDSLDMWLHGFATAIWGLVLWVSAFGLLVVLLS